MIYTLYGRVDENDFGENYNAVFIGSDVVARWAEKFNRKQVSVRYWCSDREKSPEEMKLGALLNAMGIADADYSDRYSDLTGYLWTDEEFTVGGHNVLDRLRSLKGKYVYLEVEVGSPAKASDESAG